MYNRYFNRASLMLVALVALALVAACGSRGVEGGNAGADANANASNTSQSNAPSSYIDLVGKWEGQSGGQPSTLIITSHSGEFFNGTKTVGDFQIKVAGVIDLKTRQITIRETDVLKGQGNYALGLGTGVVAPNSRQMSGEWKTKGSASTFTFSK